MENPLTSISHLWAGDVREGADPQAKYGCTINVLDAGAVSGIGNFTFIITEEEQ
jgi:hypothetical protein